MPIDTTARRAEIEARLREISAEIDHVQTLDPYSPRFQAIGDLIVDRRAYRAKLATLDAAEETSHAG